MIMGGWLSATLKGRLLFTFVRATRPLLAELVPGMFPSPPDIVQSDIRESAQGAWGHGGPQSRQKGTVHVLRWSTYSCHSALRGRNN